MKHRLICWLLIFTAAILIYFPSLFIFFAQDDFTHLYISQASNIKEFLNLFKPVLSGIYFRPISIQLYTFLSSKLFGLNPIGFHAIALGIHLINISLVYLLLKKFIKNSCLKYVGAFVYGVHTAHFMSIFWIAEFSMVLAPCFAFLGMLAYLNKKYGRFLIFMVLGMLSNELVLIVPLVVGLIDIMQKEKVKYKYVISGILIAGIVLLIRFVLIPTSLGSEYILSTNPVIWFKNLKWYLFRGIGLAEGFRAHLDMWQIKVSLIALFGVAAAFIRKVKTGKLFWVGLGWFGLGVLPMLILSHHQSPIYLIIGLPGLILTALSLLPQNLKFNWKTASILGLYFLFSLLAVRAMQEYHWVTQRARLAQYHLQKIANHKINDKTVVSFINSVPESSKHIYFALGGDKAVKVFFGRQITVKFEDFEEVSFSPNTIFIFARKQL